jgi:hypothetical protein
VQVFDAATARVKRQETTSGGWISDLGRAEWIPVKVKKHWDESLESWQYEKGAISAI